MTLVAEDVRLSRTFDFRERAQLTLIGEVFNLFNIANLSGRDGDEVSPLTTHLSAWYAGSTIFAFCVIVALALFGFYTSTSGKPRFLGVSLDA
jgi:hypothetical protein